MDAVPPTSRAGRRAVKGEYRKYYVLTLLAAVQIVNYADQTLMSVVAPQVQRDLQLSDTQVGAITGLAFSLLYGVAGLFLARWGDRVGQSRILAASVVVWSTICAFTARAHSFEGLFVARLGLGMSESAAAPTSYALIRNSFSEGDRSFAYALVSAGSTIGIGLGVALGSWLGSLIGWRSTMVVMALPGLVLGLLIAMTLRDQGKAEPRPTALASPGAIARDIFRDRLRRVLVVAFAIATFAYAGFAQWAPTFYMRVHHMTLEQVGTSYSLTSTAGALMGLFVGGVILGGIQRRNRALSLALSALLLLVAAAASASAFLVEGRIASLLLFAGFGVAAGSTYAPTIALFQDRCEPGTHAFAAAVMFLVATLIGQGGGPFLVGLVSDHLRAGGMPDPLSYALLVGTAALLLAASCYLVAMKRVMEESAGARV